MSRIGLVAGEGKLPTIFSRVAKKKGDKVIAFGLKGVTDEGLRHYVDKMHWLEWGSLQKAALLFVTERIGKIILLGKVRKEMFFAKEKEMDESSKKILDKISTKKDYAILNEVAGFLKKFGIEILDSTVYLSEFIPEKGVLTKRHPAKEESTDVEYGKDIAMALAGFDIGQTVIVKDRTVVALEAMEGTDETIIRAGSLMSGGFVVVKMARPKQDMRFDVPLVGLDTLKALIKAGGKVLALEAGKTFLIDKNEVIALADEKGVSIVII